MKKACSLTIILLAAAGLLAGCANTGGLKSQSQTATSLWARKGEMVVQYSSPVGELPANPRPDGQGLPFGSVDAPFRSVDAPLLLVEAMKFTAPDARESVLVVAVRKSSGSPAYVPVAEIPGLVKAIDRLSAIQPGAPPFEKFKAEYKSPSGFAIHRSHPVDEPRNRPIGIRFTSGAEGSNEVVYTSAENLEKFKQLLIEAEKRLR